jgi:hypothetical protein
MAHYIIEHTARHLKYIREQVIIQGASLSATAESKRINLKKENALRAIEV